MLVYKQKCIFSSVFEKICLDPFRVHTFSVWNVFLFSHVHTELYEDYKDRRYGPDAAPFAVENSDSDAEIVRPGSKLDSPGAYDSWSEDAAMNEKIASRRHQIAFLNILKL